MADFITQMLLGITWEVLFSLSRIRSFTSRTRDAIL